jgi:hypothetical protein
VIAPMPRYALKTPKNALKIDAHFGKNAIIGSK